MANTNKMSRAEAGRKGGEARVRKYSKEELSQQAKQGAQTIENKIPGFHAKIGQIGGQARGKQDQQDIQE